MKKMQATKQMAMGGWHIKPGEFYYVSEIRGSAVYGNVKAYRLCRTKSRQSMCATVAQSTVNTMTEAPMD